jgi:hypothetical protein
MMKQSLLGLVCASLIACTASVVPDAGGATDGGDAEDARNGERDAATGADTGTGTDTTACATAPRTGAPRGTLSSTDPNLAPATDGFATYKLYTKDNYTERHLIIGFTAYENACGYASAGLTKLGSSGTALFLKKGAFADQPAPVIKPGTYDITAGGGEASLRLEQCGPRSMGPFSGELTIEEVNDTHVKGVWVGALDSFRVTFDLPICNPPGEHDALSERCCAP